MHCMHLEEMVILHNASISLPYDLCIPKPAPPVYLHTISNLEHAAAVVVISLWLL